MGVSKYTQQVADHICNELAEGKSLRSICKSDKVPSIETVRNWLRTNDAFLAQYARARDEQADFYADDIIDIADTEPDPNIARVRIDARKWVASKLKPKVYGDRVQQDVTITEITSRIVD